jgi:hypothetical protein
MRILLKMKSTSAIRRKCPPGVAFQPVALEIPACRRGRRAAVPDSYYRYYW